MNEKHRTAALLAAAFVIAAPSIAAVPAVQAPQNAASAAMDLQLGNAYLEWLARIFAVPATADLDLPLRDAMSALVDEHLARMRTLVPEWISQERAREGAAPVNGGLERALRNRMINEIALWRLESPGADYDAVLARAIVRPGVCTRAVRDNLMGLLMDEFQAVPPADRPTLLAGERALLAHWGTPRTSIPARPQPSLADQESAEITRLRSGESAPDVAMVPFLADAVLKDDKDKEMPGSTLCALHQWGLARALHRGDAPATALLSWRYATLKTAESWVPPDTATKPADYPRAALMAGVIGIVDVRVTPDAQGRFGSASIAKRQLTVPGVVDNPPVAFETVFDAASLAGAPDRFTPVKPPADGSPPGAVTVRIDWRLD